MSTPTVSPGDHAEPERYEIRVQGHLDARWGAWFPGLGLTHDVDGTTLLAGPVVDQAALHGMLRKVRDLGLPLLSVRRVAPKSADGPEVGP